MMAKPAPTTTREPRKADRVVATNRKAFHEYFVLETIEAGIVLTGTEIKSIREGKATLTEDCFGAEATTNSRPQD